MNTSAMNDKWRDKSAGTVPQKTKVIQYRSKEKEKIDNYAFRLNKSNKTSTEICKTTTNQRQYPTNTTDCWQFYYKWYSRGTFVWEEWYI